MSTSKDGSDLDSPDTSQTLISQIIESSAKPEESQAFFPEDCVFHPTVDNYIMIIAFCTIFCLSVIGNSVVVVVILQQRSLRTVTNIYLLNLALSDLLLSVVCMPPTLVSSLVYCWVFGDVLCKLLAYLQPVVVSASAYTLVAIALERYFALVKPLQSRIWHTRTHAMSMIALVWLIAIISNFFMLFMYELRTYNRTGINCAPKFDSSVNFGYQIYMTVVLLVIPLVLMVGLYGSVIKSLRTGIRMDIAAIEVGDGNSEGSRIERSVPFIVKAESTMASMKNKTFSSKRLRSQRGINENGNNNNNSPAHQNSVYVNDRKTSSMNVEQSLRSTHSGRTALAKQRLIRMLIVIVIIFFSCWSPSYVWWLLLNAQDAFGTFNVWNTELNTFITVLTYLSSCTNPITYCFLNSKFRNALFVSFGCNKRNGRSHFQRVYAPGNSICNTSIQESNFTESLTNGRNRFRSMPLKLEMLARLKNVMNGTSNNCQNGQKQAESMEDPLVKKTNGIHLNNNHLVNGNNNNGNNVNTGRDESKC